MQNKLFVAILFSACIFSACNSKMNTAPTEGNSVADGSTDAAGNTPAMRDKSINIEPTPAAAGAQPKSIRDFFMLLPEKYFVLEGCVRETDKDCTKAKIDYLRTFTEVEDTANGYLKGGCDGAQSCLEMTIFKRPDSSYLVGVATSAEMMNEFYFLDYANGKWNDISADVVPQFNKKNIYEFPRQGTTVKVFAKKVIEKGDDYEVSDKGEKLYDLEWKNGKFAVKK